MAEHVIKVPDIGEGIAEVELVAWHVNVGDTVGGDQVVAELMTDKATVEVPTAHAGRIVARNGNVGDKLAVGSELLRIEWSDGGTQAAGAEGDAPPGGSASRAEPPKPPGAPAATVVAPQAAVVQAEPSPPSPLGKPLASPSVRRHARELGIDLRAVRGSGPGGRIRHEDLEQRPSAPAVPKPPAERYAKRSGEEQLPVVGLRRQIANRMRDSLRIPHFTYVEEIDVTELEALRVRLNEQHGERRGRLTVLPFLIRAIVLALPSFPQMNARFDDEKGVVTRYAAVHVGVATQSDAGLMVTVVRHAEALDLWATAAEIARLSSAARAGKATRDELTGSTITITSLGPLGGVVTTPVINVPEVAIVGVNRIVERPVIRSGMIVPRKLMNLSSSFDHRVVDGSDAARFIQAVRGYLEYPATLFIG